MLITGKNVVRNENGEITDIILRTSTGSVITFNGRNKALLAHRLFQRRQRITPDQVNGIR